MQIYSAYPRARARQVAADVTAAASIVGFALLGSAVGALVGSTAALGRGLESAGADFEGTMSDASRTVGGIPLLGQTVASPFSQASGAGASLAQAGRDQQALIETVSVALGLLVALVPIAIVLLIWLRRRIAFARRASEVSRLASTEDGIELLAPSAPRHRQRPSVRARCRRSAEAGCRRALACRRPRDRTRPRRIRFAGGGSRLPRTDIRSVLSSDGDAIPDGGSARLIGLLLCDGSRTTAATSSPVPRWRPP